MSILSKLAGTGIELLGNIGLGALGRSWRNADWSSQTTALNALARRNAIDSPSLQVQGLRKAGLNPALANASAFAPLAPQSANPPQVSMSLSPVDLAQANLAGAQANNLEANTTGKNIENKREIDRDLSANAQFRAQLQTWLKEPEGSDKRVSAEWLLAQDDVFSLGSIEGSERAMQWREIYSRTTANELGNAFAAEVHKAKLAGNVPQVLADLDKWQLSKLGAELAQIQTQTLALGLGMDETKASIGKLIAETANIMEDTGLKHYQSFSKLLHSGEGLAAAFVLLEKGAMALAGTLPIAGLGVAGRLAAGRSAPTTKKAFDRIRGTTNPKGIIGNSDF